MALFRRAGRWLREYVRPLVGFWDLFNRLEDMRMRMGGLEAVITGLNCRSLEAQANLSEAMSQLGPCMAQLIEERSKIQNQLAHMLKSQEQLTARNGTLSRLVAGEIDRLDGYLAHHAALLRDTVVGETGRLNGDLAHHAALLHETIVGETGRLNGDLAHHAALLGDRITTVQADFALLEAFTARPKCAYAAQDLDALVIAAGCDLVVPTEEAGLLAYLLRHGPEAIEPGVRAVLRDRLRPGAVAVDAGANVGIHTLTMASAVEAEGRVISFEPLPHLAVALQRTVRLNGFSDRAQVHQMALSDSAGEVTLHRAPHGPMSSIYSLPEHMGSEPIQVCAAALDDCIAPGERVDLIKIDVEGAEPKVWRGMQRILRDNHDIEIVLEWSASHFRRAGEDPVTFMMQVRATGLSPFVIADHHEGRLTPLRMDVAEIEACNLLLTRRSSLED